MKIATFKSFTNLHWLTPKTAFIILILSFLLLLFTNGEPFVRSDGFCYYHISKSLINENNFVSTNEPEYWNYMGHVKEKYNGKYSSVCAPGTALIHLPGLVVANIFNGDRNIENDYFIAYNGHTIYEGIAILITAMLFGLLSLAIIYKILRELKFNEKISILATASIFLSMYASWYIFLLPMFTHIYEVFAVSLILYSFIKHQNTSSLKYMILCGAAIGLSVLIRPVLLPIGLIIFIYLLINKRLKEILRIILGGIPFALIYFAYNFLSYGKFISSGYSDVRGETFTITAFNGLNVLFSPYRGLFIYSPILIFSVIGLILLYKKNRFLSILSLSTITILTSIYGFWPTWWGGGSYGSRFMMFSLPFGVIGFAYFINYIRSQPEKVAKLFFSLIGISVIYSISIFLLYRVTTISVDFYTPLHFYKTQLKILNNTGSVSNYIKSIPDNIQDGSGIIALLTGVSDYVMRVYSLESNSIVLKFYSPPYSSQSFPEKLGFYLHDQSKNVFYEAAISDIRPDSTIIIDCSNACTIKDAKLEIKMVEKPTKLPVSEYTGINIDHTQFNIYIENGKNIQSRGNIITWDPDDPNYYFK